VAPVRAGAAPLLRSLAALEHLDLTIAEAPGPAAPPAPAPGAAPAAAPQPPPERPPPAEGALLADALATLRALRTLRLAGPLSLRATDASALASSLASLSELSLCVVLPDGTLGFSRFGAALKRLSVAPYSGPAARPGDARVNVPPGELPRGLQELEGTGLAFERLPAPAGAPAGERAPLPCGRTLRRLVLRAGPLDELSAGERAGAASRGSFTGAAGRHSVGGRLSASGRPSLSGRASAGGAPPPPPPRYGAFHSAAGAAAAAAAGRDSLPGGAFFFDEAGRGGVAERACMLLPDLRGLVALRELEVWTRRASDASALASDELLGAARGATPLRRLALRVLPAEAPAGAAGRGAALVDSDGEDEDGDGGRFDILMGDALAAAADQHVRGVVGRLVRTVSGSLAQLNASLSGMLMPSPSGCGAGLLGGGLSTAASYVADLAVGAAAGMALGASAAISGGAGGGRVSASGGGTAAASAAAATAAASVGACGSSSPFAAAAGAAAAAAVAAGGLPPMVAPPAPAPTPLGHRTRDHGPFARTQAWAGPPPAGAAGASTSGGAPAAPFHGAPQRGLALLGGIDTLESLDLEVGEHLLLGPCLDAERARRALRGLPRLRSVALVIPTDRTATGLDGLGRELVAWLAPAPAGWEELRVAVKGPYAFGGASRLVASRLAAGLPRCRFGLAA
jgi:hypothetical protein